MAGQHWIRSPWTALLVALVVFGICWRSLKVPPSDQPLEVVVELVSEHADKVELFYDDGSGGFAQDRSLSRSIVADPEPQELVFKLPRHLTSLVGLRLDPGRSIASLELRSVMLKGAYHYTLWKGEELAELFHPIHDLKPFEVDPGSHSLHVHCTGPDPYMATSRNIQEYTDEALSKERPVIRPFLLSLAAALVIGILIRGLQLFTKLRSPTGPEGSIAPTSFGDIMVASVCAVVFGWLTYRAANLVDFVDRGLSVHLEITASRGDDLQVFYATEPNRFKDGHFVNSGVEGSLQPQEVVFDLPQDSVIKFIRIDLGMRQDSILIHSMTLVCNNVERRFAPTSLLQLFKPNAYIRDFRMKGDALIITTSGNDPFLMSQEDLSGTYAELHAAANNGPTPPLFGWICALYAFVIALRPGIASRSRSIKDKPQLFLIGGFITMLYLPLLAELLPIEPFVADTEKRPLAPKPGLDAHAILELPKAYSAFYSDHFPFRKSLFRWNSFFHFYVLRSSPLPDRVLLGKDGWMFLTKDKMVDYYRGFDLFSTAQLDTIAQRLNRRKVWLAERGIDYYLFVPPLKASVYPEMLPDLIHRIGPRSGLDQVKDYLITHSNVQIIDLREELKGAKDSLVLYYKTDIHWNRDGALIGYQVLMRSLLKDHPELGTPCQRSDFIVQNDTNDLGDLAMQLAMNDVLTRVSHDMTPRCPYRAVALPERVLPGAPVFRNYSVFMRGPDPTSPRLLMFRDSFGVYLIPFLSEHFSTSTYVWTPVWIPEIVEQEKPDIVVHELMEVFLDELLDEEIITTHVDAQSAN